MGIFSNFGFKFASAQSTELPNIFPFPTLCRDFVKSDILSTYTKILTDVVERTHGIPEKAEKSLWDSCVQSEASDGLVTLLATAMQEKSELFLVWNKGASGILRKADSQEEATIRADYLKNAKSSTGVFVSFKNYRLTDMLTIYSNLEYCILASLHKAGNLSKAVQIKISDLRSSVGALDGDVPKKQAQDIAAALVLGNDVMLDAKDIIETATVDTTATEKSIAFLDAKRAFILAFPIAYITGTQTGGIGSTGESDTKAIERGLKLYFVSIIQPVCQALYGKPVEFKSEDFRQVTSALETLKTFDLISDELLPLEDKVEIIARMFDLDPDKAKERLKKALEARAQSEKQQADEMKARAQVVPAVGKAQNA